MRELVQFEQRDNIVLLTLKRPEKHNALNLALWGELEAKLDLIGQLLDKVSVVILQSAGQDFCAGNDLKERGTPTPLPNYQASIITRLANLLQPLITCE